MKILTSLPALCAIPVAMILSATLIAQTTATDCSSKEIHCAGAGQEFTSVQKAVDKAKAGHTVVVYEGAHEGFELDRSGKKNSPITITTAGSVTFRGANRTGDSVVRITNVEHVILENFSVDGTGVRYGIAARDARPHTPMINVTLRNTTVKNSESTNIYLSNVAESLITGNEAAYSKSSHGIYLSNAGSDNTVLERNHTHHNFKNGIHLNGDSSVGGDGMHSGITITNNLVHENQGNGLDLDGIKESTISNNIIYGNGRHAIRAFKIDSAEGPQQLRIYNNTLVSNKGWGIKLSDSAGKHIIFNNILLDDEGSIALDDNSSHSDYNIIGGRFQTDFDADAVLSMAQWHALGQDANSIQLKLSDLFSGNYLQPMAPAGNYLKKGVIEYQGVQSSKQDYNKKDADTAAPHIGAVAP